MKLFEVVFEMDDRRPDAPKGALRNEKRFYAAWRAEDVWKEIEGDRIDQSLQFISLAEVLPAIRIIEWSKPEGQEIGP